MALETFLLETSSTESVPNSAPALPKDVERAAPAPPKPSALRSASQYFRFRLFDLYKRLFTIVALLNLLALIGFCIAYTEPTVANIALTSVPISVNLFLAILFRTEDFVNVLYLSVLWVPMSWPLWFRRRLAKVYQFGGVHSGSGVAAAAWTLLFTVQITRSYSLREHVGRGTLSITYITMVLLLAIVVSAQPSFRRLQHNKFEAIHRFCGWGSLFLFWALTFTMVSDVSTVENQTFGYALAHSPTFWFLILITLLIVLPWTRLRRLTVQATTPSNHLTRLYFPSPKARPTQTVRISTAPWLEWHSFAIIPQLEETARTEGSSAQKASFSVLVSSAGDWTRSVIADKNTTRSYWIRGVPTTGVTIVARLFRKAIVVATGSGIGPILSLMYAAKMSGSRPATQCRLIWSTQAPEATYGSEVMREVYDADPEAVIWDTRAKGRPDLVAMAQDLYREVGAEAVVVVSNQKVTQLVVFGLESRGIPAYGPIFDS